MLSFLRFRAILSLVLALAVLLIMGSFPTLAQTDPVFGETVIARDYTQAQLKPIDVLPSFPSGMAYLTAVMPVQNPLDKGEIILQWYKDGQPFLNSVRVVMDSSTFTVASSLKVDTLLSAGQYEIRFSYQNKMVGHASVKLVDGPFIYPPHFGDDCGKLSAELVNPRSTFPAGVVSIGFTAQTANITVGSMIDIDWLLNDQPLAHLTWTTTTNNQVLCSTYSLIKNGLTNGVYTVKLSDNGRLLQSGKAEVKS